MNELCCGFIGHKLILENIKEKLNSAINNVITKGVTTFYDGFHGEFDELALNCLKNIKEKNRDIKIVKVLTHYTNEKLNTTYDESILPDLEYTHYKAKIIERNKWIIRHSDILICYVKYNFNSNSYKMLNYAKKLNKTIINLAQLDE